MALAGGQRLTAALLNLTLGVTVGDTQDAIGTYTSTTFSATMVTGGPVAGVAFIAPASGNVIVHNTDNVQNSGTGRSHGSFRIGTGGTVGSGTLFLAASDANSIAMQSGDATDDSVLSKATLVTGLTPGATYNVQQQFRVTAGTGTSIWRRLVVQPVV